MNEKILTTQGRQREQAPVSGKSSGFVSIHELRDGKINLDDQSYCVRFAKPEEWAGLRKQVEARRAKIPAWSFWKCGKCGFMMRKAGDAGGGPCLRCNLQNYADGSQLEKISAKEGAKFEKDEAERFNRDVERLGNMAYNTDCTDRKNRGLPILTHEQFDVGRQAEQRLEVERSQVRPKAKS